MENLSSSSAGSGMGSLGGLFLALKSVSCASTLSAFPMFLFLWMRMRMIRMGMRMRMRIRMAQAEDKLLASFFPIKRNPGEDRYNVRS